MLELHGDCSGREMLHDCPDSVYVQVMSPSEDPIRIEGMPPVGNKVVVKTSGN